jgi:hypothetical protein
MAPHVPSVAVRPERESVYAALGQETDGLHERAHPRDVALESRDGLLYRAAVDAGLDQRARLRDPELVLRDAPHDVLAKECVDAREPARRPRRLDACEHAFVSIKGSPYARFQRSLATRNLRVILPAAAELQWINLADSLEILALMAQAGDRRFERAAARWVGRLLIETPPMTLKEARWAVAMVEQLPRCRESLHELARRR